MCRNAESHDGTVKLQGRGGNPDGDRSAENAAGTRWPTDWFVQDATIPDGRERDRASQGISSTTRRLQALMGPSPLFYKRIASRWAGAETSLAMPVEGKTTVCLLDSGARCNECTPEFIVERDLRFLPITDVDWVPENFMLVGLGGYLVRPMGVTVMEVDTPSLSIGGKQDHIFFVVEDPSNYRRQIPVILGSNYLKYMVEATKESEAANLPEEMQIVGQAYKATSRDPVFGPYAQ